MTDNADDFMDMMGIRAETKVPNILRPWMTEHNFELVRTIDEVRDIITKAIASGFCSLDLETEGLDNRIRYREDGSPETVHKIVGVCICYDQKTGYYIPMRHDIEDGENHNVQPLAEVEKEIARLCHASIPKGDPDSVAEDPLSYQKHEKPQVVIAFWNGKFDQEFLLPITGMYWWHPASWEDGNLACYCIYAGDNSLSLKDKAKQLLKDSRGNPYEMIKLKELFDNKSKDIRFATLDPTQPAVARYGGSDAICTYMLCQRKDLIGLCHQRYSYTYRLEKQVAQVMRTMERNQVKIDREKIRGMLREQEDLREAILQRIKEFAKANGKLDLDPGSPKQLSDFLFEPAPRGLNISPKPERNEASGQYKTDAATLEELAKDPNAPPILKDVVSFREAEKFITTYLLSLANNPDENDEIRVQFKQTGASSGRFSAPAGDASQGFSGVPIHGIPGGSEVRRAFVSRTGYTKVKADFAAEELRIASNVSNETVWIEEFLHGEGDLHSITARAFFGKQEVSKEERGMGKCVHPDTLVVRNGRLAPVRLLGDFPSQPDTFKECSYPISVWVGDSNRSVKALYNGGTKPLVHVVTSGGIVTCTLEHRFKMRDGSLIRAGDLTEGSKLAVVEMPSLRDCQSYDSKDPEGLLPVARFSLWDGIPKSEYTLSDDLAYFAGVYAGDGTGNESSASLTHGDSEKLDHYGNPYEDWVRTLEDSCSKCGFTTTRKEGALYLGSRVFVRFLESIGVHRKKSKLLRVPSWVLASNRETALHYLSGLFDTDGTVGADTHILDWTTKDFVFGGQVATLLRACGLDFNTEVTFNKTYQRHYVRLRLTVASSWQFAGLLRHAGKRDRLREPKQVGQVKDRFEVLQVLPAGEGLCLDLTIDSDEHLYVTNGFITHNTANFALLYGGGPQAIMRAVPGCDPLEARRKKDAFDKSVPKFAEWLKQQKDKVKKDLGVWTAFGRWLAIPEANVQPGQIINGKPVDAVQAKKIRSACERYATNYPIQGAGADIMKIALVLLHKKFRSLGWLREGGDDSVRMELTVHDEIVFEIRDDRVVEAIPYIVDIMEAPWKMPKNPKWQVPLVVEPLIGYNWKSGFSAERAKTTRHGLKPENVVATVDGIPLKKGEVLVNGFIYSCLRKPSEGEALDRDEVQEGKLFRVLNPAWLGGREIHGYGGSDLASQTEPATEPQTPPVIPDLPSKMLTQEQEPSAVTWQPLPMATEQYLKEVLHVRLLQLNERSVDHVLSAILLHGNNESGRDLVVTDPAGEVMIPSGKFKVDEEPFIDSLMERNLIATPQDTE